MSNFYNRLDEQKSTEYGKRIRIDVDLRKYQFELIYRQTEQGFHRTITCFQDNQIVKTDSHQQSMIGEFNRENIENQFDQFIDEGWTNYTPAK